MPNLVDIGLQITPGPWLPEAHDLTRQPLWEQWVEAWLSDLVAPPLASEGYELGILLTDDREIQRLNRDYRGQDKSTDVLAFATADDTSAPDWMADCPVYLGDVVISMETALRLQQSMAQRSNAAHTLTEEVAWLAAHGILHLLGWDHPNDLRLNQMLEKQAQLLHQVDLTAPYNHVSQLTPIPTITKT